MGEVDINVLSGRALWELCQELDLAYDCGIAISLDTQVAYNNLNIIINQEIKDNPEIYESLIDQYADSFVDEYGYTYEKNYIADVTEGEYIYKFISMTSEINIPYIVEGRAPEALNEVAIFPEFAEANNLAIGDTMTVRGERLTITGFMYKVEFLFPIFSLQSMQFDAATQTLILATKETLDNLNEYLFIKYLVRGDLDLVYPDFGYESIQSNDYSLLGNHMQMVQILMPADINFRVIALDSEITNATAFINIFLPLFVVLVGMLILIFMKRYIDHNQNDLKILHALGYTKQEQWMSLMLYPTLIACTSLIGYLIGLVVSNQLFDLYSARYLFPKPDFQLYGDIFVYAVIIPILIIFFANGIFIWQALRESTHKKRPKVRLHRFIETKMLMYTTILFLTISLMIVFGLSGNSMFTEFIDHTKTGNHYHEMIQLQYMTNEDPLDTYETYTKTGVMIEGVNGEMLKTVQSSTVYGIQTDTTLKRLIDDDISNNQLLEDGIIVSEYLHTSLGVNVGDTLSYTIHEIHFESNIVGISNELIENNIYMLQSDLNAIYNLDETYYNGLFTTDYDYQSPYIVIRVDYVNSMDQFAAILNVSSMIVNYLVVLSMVLGIFIFALVLMNFFSDHKTDIAVLKSLGYYNYEIHYKYLLILYIIMVVSYIVTIPITDQLLNYLLAQIMDTIGFKLIVNIRILTMLLGIGVLHLLFGMVAWFSTSYYDSIPIATILKGRAS
jgi:ABC-type lipoprotein release transport system permease subunit